MERVQQLMKSTRDLAQPYRADIDVVAKSEDDIGRLRQYFGGQDRRASQSYGSSRAALWLS